MSAADTIAEAERRIRAYEAMGWHRTGWEADDQAADWLIEELRAAGIEAEEQRFTAPRWHWSGNVELRIGPWSIPGEPLSDGGLTPLDGIAGGVGFVDSADLGGYDGSSIAVWRRGPEDRDRMAAGVYDDLARLEAAGVRVVVLIMGDEHGSPVLRNAERPWDPIGLPVLQVAPENAEVGVDWSEEATVVVEGRREEVEARNVIGEIPGTDSDAAPVALITPKSGWFTCAAERGGGIAVWLAVAERIAGGERPRRTLRLVASSGHELHHLGLEAYLQSLGSAASEVSAWLHLGASIGARRGTPAVAASDDQLMAIARSALEDNGIERAPFPVGTSGYGEARNIAEIGGRYISLLGGHPYFHSPNDTYANAVDPDLLQRHTEAVEGMARELLG